MVYFKIRHATTTFLFNLTSPEKKVDCDKTEALLQSGNKSISYRKANKMHQRACTLSVWHKIRQFNSASGLEDSGKNKT